MWLTDSLVSYRKMDGNSNDSTANWNNGTDTDMSYDNAYGIINQWASANGTSSCIQLPADWTWLNITWGDARSVSFWLKTSDTGGYIIGLTDGLGGDGRWIWLNVWPWSSSGCFAFYDGNWTPTSVSANDNVYHHRVFTKNGSSLVLYKDWASVFTSSNGWSTTSSAWQGKALMSDGRTSGKAQYTSWYIDEVGVRSKELSSTEVTALYNGGAGITYPFSTSIPTGAAFLYNMI